jgi:hypothetical protein
MEKQSFNYTISSSDRINSADNQIYYDIDFGGFSSNNDNYKIEVVNCVFSGGVAEDNGYLIMTCDGLNENGVFCRKVLNSTESILCVIPVNVDVLMSSGGIEFIANNIRTERRIRIKLLKPDFTPVVDGTDINVGIETEWLLTLRLTPVD